MPDSHVPAESSPSTTSKVVDITCEVDIAAARIAGAQLLSRTDCTVTEKYSVITAISELAANMFHHAGSGTITISLFRSPDGTLGIEVVAEDQGPGIENIELAMQDGYTTNGGLGGGLPGVKRLMSELEISSTVGVGTTIRAVKWPRPSIQDAETAALSAAKSKKKTSG